MHPTRHHFERARRMAARNPISPTVTTLALTAGPAAQALRLPLFIERESRFELRADAKARQDLARRHRHRIAKDAAFWLISRAFMAVGIGTGATVAWAICRLVGLL